MEVNIIKSLRTENENLKSKVEGLEFVNSKLVSRVASLEKIIGKTFNINARIMLK